MKRLFSFFTVLLFSVSAFAQFPAVKEKTGNLKSEKGYFEYWFDENNDKMWLKVDKLNEEFLYANYLAAGVGSNDIGLDRSQQGGQRVVYFERRGPKLMLIQPNLRYIADSDNALERKSVQEAFASSILFGFKIEAEDNGAYLIDLTPFLLRDAHNIPARLRGMNEGNFSLDSSRSSLYKEGTFNFPKNTEFETLLTFTGSGAGREVRSVVPDPSAITVRQHHSFVELPDDNYTPREFDPRGGFFSTSYQDYAAPIGEPMTKRFINRHRLQKKNPNAAVSEPVKPIVYYLDNGTPEPVRTALLDGARWWDQAFEAAGYKNAFQVKVLPDDAHPLDIRYNMINWVHRSTRGWSYGGSVTDPRTGEIIKGNVLLGSLRVRQDYMIAQGLLSPFKNNNNPDPQMLDMALARIRQLSAHEIGHTLGMYHNYAASISGDASVMDYPHPKIDIVNGKLEINEPYKEGIGEWDKAAITFGYSHFPKGTDEKAALNKILEDAAARGLRFIADSDSRPEGSAHPYAHLWEYGEKPVEQLEHMINVRKIALDNFSEAAVPFGTTMSELQDVLVPIYLFHRYQVEAAVKALGGMDYTYKLRGDNQAQQKIVPIAEQNKALDMVLKTISPEFLAVPEKLLNIIPPRAAGLAPSRELFSSNTSPALDALSIAQSAADLTLNLLLNPQRANRLVEFGTRGESPELGAVIDKIMMNTLHYHDTEGYYGAVQQTVNFVFVKNLIKLHASNQANPLTKAVVQQKLIRIKDMLARHDGAMDQYNAALIESYFDAPKEFVFPQTLPMPPGAPIGSESGF